ncbi:multi-sensor signal transduction histidine kinase [Halobiforma nitratireducens JCM 10879]|uniref:histidine kinase n=1 Tax=Halobiforma nitratireducens JCM 10879 TaxID=1227454 RepID=M0LZN7_9EURY|nr:multi-sensor signal transduction histidine kinase [Halobiforma nitratireducens JCM 10879]
MEEPIRALHEVAFDLQSAESEDEVCRRTVDAAEHVLSFDTCIVALVEGETLRVRARSSGLPEDGVVPTRHVDEGVSGLTYRTGKPHRFDDLSRVDEAKPEGEYESGLSVPIGDYGVFQAASDRRGSFSETDLELAELLAEHAATALDRIDCERELERFVSVVSHDLRSPLTVACGRLELARAAVSPDGDATAHLTEIGASLERMDSLLEKLLTLARRGQLVERGAIEPVSLHRTVADAWTTVETEPATLVLSVDESATLEADRGRLRQLLENLFRNSIEHSVASDRCKSGPIVDDERDSASDRRGVRCDGATGDASSAVTITVGTLPDGFYVEDDGPGIPTDVGDEVFSRGYTTSDDGTGFGLYIVRRIARGHDWSVSVTTGDDGGARFEITGVGLDSCPGPESA